MAYVVGSRLSKSSIIRTAKLTALLEYFVWIFSSSFACSVQVVFVLLKELTTAWRMCFTYLNKFSYHII